MMAEHIVFTCFDNAVSADPDEIACQGGMRMPT